MNEQDTAGGGPRCDRRHFLGLLPAALGSMAGWPSSVRGVLGFEAEAHPRLRFLTSDPQFVDSRPCFSPDGETILFMRAPAGVDPVATANSNDSPWSLWTLPREGGAARPFLEHPELRLTRPAWSWTSGSIAISGVRGGAGELWVAGGDGAGLSRIPVGEPPMRALFYPSWFPDGVTVAVTDYSARRVLAVDTRDGSFRQLTDPETVMAGMCSVSPVEGADYPLAFAGQRPGAPYDVQRNSIWLRLRSGRTFELDGLHGRMPSWSPLGDRLAFSSVRARPAPFESLHPRMLPEGIGSVFIARAPGRSPSSTAVGVTPFDHVTVHAKWSPDGRSLVCMAFDLRNERSGIGLVDLPEGFGRDVRGSKASSLQLRSRRTISE